MFYTQEQYDEAHTPFATPQDAMREYAMVVGEENRERAWIATDYDVWVPNPWYRGPKQPHPEADFPDRDEDEYAPFNDVKLLDPDFDDLPF